TGYGQKFIDAINGDWGGAPYEDLMKGLDYAEQTYAFIDKNRECALGASYGGYMINWIMGHTDRFKCLVTHDGMFNAESAWGTTEELWFNDWEFKGTPYDNRASYEKWSPHRYAKNFKTPTLVIHGQRDYRLDVSEGLQLFTTLQMEGVPSKMLYFPDEGHWVLKPQNSKLWYETVGDWCDRWTKTNLYAEAGFENAAPVAAAKSRDARTGQSRPEEMEETQRLPEKTTAPPVAMEKEPEKVETPVAPPPHAAPIVRQPAVAAERAPKAGEGGATFQIVISSPNNEVQVGADARVVISLQNLAEHQILFAHRPGTNNPEFSYTIRV